jgi:hypothetical protein
LATLRSGSGGDQTVHEATIKGENIMQNITPDKEFELYGCVLTGNETDLDLVRIARVQYLKKKMRRKLAIDIGDGPDNVADMTRALVLGMAIDAGIVTDSQIITRYHLYIQDMIQNYGGAEAIMDVLEHDKACLEQHVVAGYFLAKQTIGEEDDPEAIRMVDLPGEPVGDWE